MKQSLSALMAFGLAVSLAACGSDDSESDAPAETPAPAESEAPAPVDTSEPDLTDLDAQQAVAISEAREDFILSCGATAGTDEENCVLIWNCAVNEVGIDIAADNSQEAKLEEALDSCAAAIE
jgi:hypothetical protein